MAGGRTREQAFGLEEKRRREPRQLSRKMFVVLTLSGSVGIHQTPAAAPRRP